jgi:hypothetical protein
MKLYINALKFVVYEDLHACLKSSIICIFPSEFSGKYKGKVMIFNICPFFKLD